VRRYVTWHFNQNTIDQIKTLASENRISVSDLADYLLAYGLAALDHGDLYLMSFDGQIR